MPVATVKRGVMGIQGRKTCVKCLNRTDHWVEIQTGYFRGDDAAMKLCKKCQRSMTDHEILVLYKGVMDR